MWLIGIETARAIIVAYAVYIITLTVVLALERHPVRWLLLMGSLGGACYLAGLVVWRQNAGGDSYDMDLFLRTGGVALMLLPRIMGAVRRVLNYV